MKIAILASDGSPLGVTEKTIWGDDGSVGCGGSELAIMTLMSEWVKKGYEVVFFNNPKETGASSFEQRNIATFDPDENWDVVIIFRTPNYIVHKCKALKVWLSYDQFTSVDFMPFFGTVDKVVGISEYHSGYFTKHYNFNDMIVIDLPLRVEDFVDIDVEKDLHKCIYTSVPGRGLMNLHAMWPIIKRDVPDASLTITSDYRLWGISDARDQDYRHHFMGANGVRYSGALDRRKYLKELCCSSLLLYPHKEVNCELFCISTAEAQYAGAYPITSNYGALETTNMGTVIDGDPEDIVFRDRFIEETVSLLSNTEELKKRQSDVIKKSFDRFNPEFVLHQWEDKVFNG